MKRRALQHKAESIFNYIGILSRSNLLQALCQHPFIYFNVWGYSTIQGIFVNESNNTLKVLLAVFM